MSGIPLLNSFSDFLPVRSLHERLSGGNTGAVVLRGLAGSLKSFIVAELRRSLQGPILAVSADEEAAEQLRDDLVNLLGEGSVRYLPPLGVARGERIAPHKEATALRIEGLRSLAAADDAVVVSTAGSLTSPCLPSEYLSASARRLSVHETVDVEELVRHLVDIGYESVRTVQEAGQISRRGGIVDVFSFGNDNPLRIDLFGDEIDSIRFFDPSTQRSLHPVDEATVLPAREIVFLNRCRDNYLESVANSGLDTEERQLLEGSIRSGIVFDGMEGYLPFLCKKGSCPATYVRESAVVFVDDPDGCDARASGEEAKAARAVGRARPSRASAARSRHPSGARTADPGREGLSADLPYDGIPDSEAMDGEPIDPKGEAVPLCSPNGFRARLGHCRVVEHEVLRSSDADSVIPFDGVEGRLYQRNLDLLRDDLQRLSLEGYRIQILCESESQAERLSELLDDLLSVVSVGKGSVSRGFQSRQLKIAVITDHEIFGRYPRRFRYRRIKGASPVKSFTALQRGDYIVHIDHGIGQFRDIVKLTVDAKVRDCLLVVYRDGDKLYVPVEQLDRIQKYSVEESVPPALSKLGGSGWERLKEQTKKAIFDMAQELVALYAERKSRPGYAFSKDTQWQNELEASFVYQETPDQLTATADVKADLEKDVPMDRLICGDVGYGKTEVAVRAAFKAVQDGKQVAVLVPTTILAQQHYDTFAERMAPFPVRLEMLSRFRTQRELKSAVKAVSSGGVDIVVGTHRLLSDDVRFKELGLVIIDEEQRFGVKHKEKLKLLRKQVDCMAMTATPIPRTLHMALLGARDMSIITTPPKDRLPIVTEILPFEVGRISEAIHREVDRGGQVYFVHNRVQSIESMAEFLERELPQVRFAVAHGQMPPRQLEKIMLDFLTRRFDCLVATMIIESGLDIPNVNTIIINRADRFGLSQLYQIRGRVGRSSRRAYAYLVIPPRKALQKTAQRRLLAIEEFSDLGAGFSIAMRDLEIRGAGNLVGAQQHGFIAAVGFDLYCRLLDEAIRQLKGENVEEVPDPDLRIRASAYLPEEYVQDPEQKISLYQRLAEATQTVTVLEIEEEMRDRYGRCPVEVVALLNLIQIKILSKQLRAVLVDIDDLRLRLVFPHDWRPSRQKIAEMIKRSPALLSFFFGGETAVEASLNCDTDVERLELARCVLQEMV